MASSKPPRKAASEETRTHILNTALRLFRQQGFDQTTMRQIAADAGMALGAAYYYFPSKEALVMAFYERAQEELSPLLEEALTGTTFEHRLSALLETKFKYFHPHRGLLGALSHHIDPHHPLSPFSSQTKSIRDKDVGHFAQVLEGSHLRIPSDLKPHLPRLLWLYQMGLLLFWVYDTSEKQVRTRQLVEKSLSIVATLAKFAGFPLLRPLRKRVVDLLLAVSAEPSSPGSMEEE